MTQVTITEISGGTYPINVYISDIFGEHKSLLGSINAGPVPPTVDYNNIIPPIFNTAPAIMLTLIDNNGCEVFKVLDCAFGCTFQITIQLASCAVNFILI